MTGPAVVEARRDRRKRHGLRVAMWLLAPLVDSWEGLSLNRFLAIGFAWTAVHGRLFHDQPITGWDLAMATLAGALAFGKDVFLDFLENRKTPSPGE